MQSRSVHLMLPSSQTNGLETYAYFGENSKGHLTFPPTSRLVLIMKERKGIIDSNDTEILNITGNNDRDTLAINHIELLIPLRAKQRLVGVLLIGNKFSKEPYSTEDRRLLRKVVSQVSTGIENAYLYEGIQKKHRVSKEVMDGVLHAMSLAVEMRDPYTAGHQRQVAILASEIAREMGLSEWDIEGIRIMGLLHDVGKISVPAEILSKPGQINQHEFSIVKTTHRPAMKY